MSAQAAAAIRKDLKANFPNTNFSVKADAYAVRIEYTDGPKSKSVENIVSKYEGAQTDYFLVSREMSEETKNTIMARRGFENFKQFSEVVYNEFSKMEL